MKLVTRIDSSIEKTTASSSIKVCMHVLGTARTDVRVMRAAHALVGARLAVTIVDLAWQQKRPVEETIDNVRVKHVISPDWYTSRRFKPWFLVCALLVLVRSTLCLLQTPADIYHAHDTTALPACFLAALFRRKSLIFDAHELPLSNEMGNARWNGLITPFAKLLSIIVPRCAGVITVSAPIAREIHKRYSGVEVTLVRNVPVYQKVSKDNRLREYLGLGLEVRIALYQGVLSDNRELDRLVRAAPFLERNIVIALMGPDADGTQARLEVLIASEGVADRVKIVPPVPYAELLRWTSSADIGLVVYSPGHSQNVQMCLPNKLFEYLTAGLPVLASSLDAVADLIKTYDVGQIVSSLASEDVGRAINTILADPAEYARMRCNALHASQEDLCWEKESQVLAGLYHRILGIRDGEDNEELSSEVLCADEERG